MMPLGILCPIEPPYSFEVCAAPEGRKIRTEEGKKGNLAGPLLSV
jgi:hypothetical protein